MTVHFQRGAREYMCWGTGLRGPRWSPTLRCASLFVHDGGVRTSGTKPYSIIDDKTGEELERVSTASSDDYEAMMAAKARAIELGLSPKKVNDYQLNNLRNS